MGGSANPAGAKPNTICDDSHYAGPDTPTVFGGSGTVNVPVWIAGDVCTSGGNSPIRNPTTGSPITVHIGGFIYGSNGPAYIVGAPGNNVANFEAIGGCYDKHTNSGQLPLACDTGRGRDVGKRQLGDLLGGLRRNNSDRDAADALSCAGAHAVQHRITRSDPSVHRRAVGRHLADEPVRQRRQRGARHEPRHAEPDHATRPERIRLPHRQRYPRLVSAGVQRRRRVPSRHRNRVSRRQLHHERC